MEALRRRQQFVQSRALRRGLRRSSWLLCALAYIGLLLFTRMGRHLPNVIGLAILCAGITALICEGIIWAIKGFSIEK